MKKKFFLFLILTLSILGCSNSIILTPQYTQYTNYSINNTLHTTVGNIKYHNLKTKLLKSGNRDIIVYLPPSYNTGINERYPVLYMHDGQNIFDKATGAYGTEWYVDEKLEYLINKKVINEIIVVGIYNGLDERLSEYTWNPMEGYGGGGGKEYGDFLTTVVKPFIDKTYRTKADRKNTAVIGSSLGGLISFYLAKNYPLIFSKIGMMSPSLWWNKGEAVKDADSLNANFDFWIDGGTNESETMVYYVEKMFDKLKNKLGDIHVMEYIQNGANHGETAWATRIHAPLIQFFGQETDPDKKQQLIKKLMIYEEWANL